MEWYGTHEETYMIYDVYLSEANVFQVQLGKICSPVIIQRLSSLIIKFYICMSVRVWACFQYDALETSYLVLRLFVIYRKTT